MSTNDFLDQVQESEQRGDISSLKDRVRTLEDRVRTLEERADTVDSQIRPLREKVEGVHYATPIQPSHDIGELSTQGQNSSFSTFDALVIAAVLAVIVVLVLIVVLAH